MVDWSLARQVARLAAGSGDEGTPQADVAALCAEMEKHVAAYTGLSPGTPVPAAELVGRGEWADVNLDSLALLLDPVGARLEQRMEFAGPLAGALKAGAAATLAAEAGLVIGYVAQRVLGQYEVSLLGGDAPPRLLFVAPNLRKAVRELKVDPEPFHRWICAHELTHVYQFQGVDWLREHLGGWCATTCRRGGAHRPRRRRRAAFAAGPGASSSRPSATAAWPRWCRPRSSVR